MQHKAPTAGLVLAFAGVLAFWAWPGDERSGAEAPMAAAESDTPVTTADGDSQTATAPEPTGNPPGAAADSAEPPPGLTQAEAERRRREIELKQAAEERFQQAVKMDGLKPSNVRPAVRSMFRSVKLEPVVDPEDGRAGYVDGMRIAELGMNNPLSRAGFETGDRLTRINGEPLSDPAQIAHLFASLGERFEVCAARADQRRCRVITLQSPQG